MQNTEQLLEQIKENFAGIWVKVSERLPENKRWYAVKGFFKSYLWFDGKYFYTYNSYSAIENENILNDLFWLDDSEEIKQQLLSLLSQQADMEVAGNEALDAYRLQCDNDAHTINHPNAKQQFYPQAAEKQSDEEAVKEVIENAIYSTKRYLTTEASELAECIIESLKDAGCLNKQLSTT